METTSKVALENDYSKYTFKLTENKITLSTLPYMLVSI